ncbi:MAG: DUF302 domain-containing protein [Candidatus Thorarchaeota archaeon]|jgi:uncharacterized protein (DUF302 family)
MPEILRKELDMSFDDAVKRVETLSEEGGFTVMLTKGMHDMFKKKLGIDDYPRRTFILACAPDLAKKAVDISPDMSLVMPCSFVVAEEDGKVVVTHSSVMKMGVELGFAPEEPMKPLVEETSKRVHKVWDRF